MCSRTVSDTANRLLKRTDNEGSPSVVEEKSSAVPLIGAVAGLWSAPSYLIRERQEFKEEGHSFNLRTAQEQCLAAYGQTAGVPSFLPPAAGAASLRRAQLSAISVDNCPQKWHNRYAIQKMR